MTLRRGRVLLRLCRLRLADDDAVGADGEFRLSVVLVVRRRRRAERRLAVRRRRRAERRLEALGHRRHVIHGVVDGVDVVRGGVRRLARLGGHLGIRGVVRERERRRDGGVRALRQQKGQRVVFGFRRLRRERVRLERLALRRRGRERDLFRRLALRGRERERLLEGTGFVLRERLRGFRRLRRGSLGVRRLGLGDFLGDFLDGLRPRRLRRLGLRLGGLRRELFGARRVRELFGAVRGGHNLLEAVFDSVRHLLAGRERRVREREGPVLGVRLLAQTLRVLLERLRGGLAKHRAERVGGGAQNQILLARRHRRRRRLERVRERQVGVLLVRGR
mmetsp:Transcript_11442/g.48798  ORF Transcript_11442/g.48798 Transcript_11442/m.48798 type:complete len:334 (+) Transcript_11442:3345-4346(+)